MRGLFWGRKYTSIHLELSLVQKRNFEAGPTQTPCDSPYPPLHEFLCLFWVWEEGRIWG